eukprot:scaffold1525_cov142-Cylindrotheca_fusiformis.AAC.109
MARMGLMLPWLFSNLFLCCLHPKLAAGFLPISLTIPLRQAEKRSQPLRFAVEGTSILCEFSACYSYCLDNYYFPTQSATGAVFACAGDAIAQAAERKSDNNWTGYDVRRGMAYFAKGVGGGIVWAAWFGIADTWSMTITHDVLSDRLGAQDPSILVEKTTRTVVSILLEQFLVSPLLFAFWDIPLPALLRGTAPKQIPAQIQSKLIPLLIANAKLWTPVNVITYSIPLELRVLFANFGKQKSSLAIFNRFSHRRGFCNVDS